MDSVSQRIEDDLRGLVEGEVYCDDVFTQLYGCDASIYEIHPLGVVRPRSVADVVACVQYAAENQLPIHARGAGSGLAGGCLGSGIVLDFSRSMRRIVSTDEKTVTVQPGVVLGDLNRHLEPYQRLFGPDPANAKVTTMGSVLAVGQSGSRWLKYGSARDHVQRLQVVLGSGDVVELGQEDLRPGGETPDDKPAARLTSQVGALLKRHEKPLARHRPKSLVNTSGYLIYDLIDDNRLDMAKLMVGSEGTLGVITEATLRTSALPACSGLLLLMFDRLEKAAKAVQEIRRFDISACDLLDRRLLTLARETDVRYDLLFPKTAEAVLLVECDGQEVEEVKDRLQKIGQQICRKKRLAFDECIGTDHIDTELFWGLVQHVVPSLYRLTGSERAVPFVEDLAIPPDGLPRFLTEVQDVLKRFHVTASMFAHAAHGQLHIRPFLDLSKAADLQRMEQLSSELFDMTLACGGTISGEHGDGLSRSWHVRRSSALFQVFHELKRVFDPSNVLNPGKVADNFPQPLTRNLRAVTSPGILPPLEGGHVEGGNGTGEAKTNPEANVITIPLALNWSEAEALQTARSCNGCGTCRYHDKMERMCPIFRITPSEEATPRAKANLLRGALTGQIEQSEMSSRLLRRVADLCVNCHQCRDECPASVDIPKLAVECKAQHIAINGMQLSDWLLTRLDAVSNWGFYLRFFANPLLRTPWARWLLEKTTGLAQGRKLPQLARRTFIQNAARQRLTRFNTTSRKKIAYFTDIYANWYDVRLAEALVAVFKHNGFSVYVHPKPTQSGMAMVSVGAVEAARRVARRNVAALADAVRQGYQIIASEPSAALCLTHEYRNLLDNADTQLVADNTSEACSFLWELHQNGQLKLGFQSLNLAVGYHLPCHLRALGGGNPGMNLLGLIPKLKIYGLDKGCSGMAGTYGLKRVNYRNSLRVGWPLISAIREPKIQVGATECTACKIQMEQGTTKPTIHPLKILAYAYGLMPEVEELFTHRSDGLIVS